MPDALPALLTAAYGSKDKPPASGPVSAIIMVLVVFVVAIVAVLAYLNSRKGALERHEAAKLENDLRQTRELHDKLEEGSEARQRSADRIVELEIIGERVSQRIEQLDQGRREFEKTLSSVASWNDVA